MVSLSDIVVVIAGLLILTNHTDAMIEIAKTHPIASGVVLIIIAII